MSSVLDYHSIADSASKYLVKPEFERDLLNGDRNVLYKKNSTEFWCRDKRFAKPKLEIFFLRKHCWELDACVQHHMESKLFLET